MVSWDGREHVQLTSTPDSESRPRWSPDGKFLSFVSSRQDSKAAQVWLLNRSGGEAVRLTDVKGGVTDYAWSPDSRRLALVVADPDPAVPAEEDEADEAKGAAAKTPKPIVVDRYYFKSDSGGYLRGERSHLYLFDLDVEEEPRSSHRERSTSPRPPGRPTAAKSHSSAAIATTATSTRCQTRMCSSSTRVLARRRAA